jgi:hypothetical protein
MKGQNCWVLVISKIVKCLEKITTQEAEFKEGNTSKMWNIKGIGI